MKLHVLLSLIISQVILGGCGNSSPHSKLQSIYDQEYVLKFAQKENQYLYTLRSCLVEKNKSMREDLCVAALKDHTGNPITFTLQDLSELTLSQEKLDASLEKWQPYQQALKKRTTGQVAAISVGVGGSMLAVDGFAGTKRWHLQNELTQHQHNLNHRRFQQSKLTQEANKLKKIEADIKRIAHKFQDKAIPLSEEFIEFFQQGFTDLITADVIVDMYHTSYSQYNIIRDAFITAGYKPSQIIDPDFLDDFKNYSFSAFSKNFPVFPGDFDLRLNSPELIHYLVRYSKVRRRYFELDQRKILLEHKDSIIKRQAALDQTPARLTSSAQRLKNFNRKIILGVLGVAGTVLALVAFSYQGTEVIEKVAPLKNKNQDLYEVLSASSPLLAPSSGESLEMSVLSVKTILERIALLLNLTTQRENIIQEYCLPQVLENVELKAQCYTP